MDDRDALLLLSLTRGLGPTLTRRCVEACGSARAVLEANAQTLAGVEGIGLNRAGAIRQAMDQLSDGQALAREKELVDAQQVTVLALGDDAYPPLLKHIPDPPPLLYVRGQIQPSDRLALGIVGARHCTQYGREQADRFAALLVQAGLVQVSGGAYGIDAAVHRAALRAPGGRTIAVLGSGLAQPYPREHVPIFDQIVSENRGAVVSELPMNSPPAAENFPRRNRIISGLSLGVLVIEASLRSGALITARVASEEHNREVMALPGRVDSQASAGCHKIIREGWATLVTSAADVLDALGETGSLLKAGLPASGGDGDGPGGADGKAGGNGSGSLFDQNLTPSQRKILDALIEERTLDQLAAATGLAIHVIQADLTMLQIRSLVGKSGSGYGRRRR